MLLCSKGESISVEMLANGLKRAQNDERCDGIITRFRDGCEISLPQMERVRASLLAFNDNTKKPSIFLTDSIGDLNDGSIVLLAVMLSVVPLSVYCINECTDLYFVAGLQKMFLATAHSRVCIQPTGFVSLGGWVSRLRIVMACPTHSSPEQLLNPHSP